MRKVYHTPKQEIQPYLFPSLNIAHAEPSCQCIGKVCTKCNQELCELHFSWWKQRNRYKPECKRCASIREKAYRDALTPEQKQRTPERIEKDKVKSKAYYRKNKVQRDAYTVAYQRAHPDLGYRYNASHREEKKAYHQQWCKNNKLKHAARIRRYYARKQHAIIGDVSYDRILERDGWFCYICEKNIDPYATDKQSALTFDHVKPLAGKGERKGSHTEENIKPAHHTCNCRKQTKLLHEMTPYQRRGIA